MAITPTITQVATSNGVFLRIEFDEPYQVIAYARDDVTGRVWDLKEIIQAKRVHTLTLKIPRTQGDTVIVVHPIASEV